MKRLYAVLKRFQEVTEFGAMPPVDFYPFLKYVPESFLGNWVSRATSVHDGMFQLYADLLGVVRERRKNHVNKSSFMDRVLDSEEKLGLNEHQLSYLGGVAMDGGSDTSSVVILTFIKAMVCFPEVQKKAQTEIDNLIDASRSPRWGDYNDLPYVSAVVKESARWRPIGGLVPPHATSEGESSLSLSSRVHNDFCLQIDSWIDGRLIPKGSMVIVNAWGLHQDASYFPNPDEFDPSRYAGRTLLAPEYAASPDYESRDHYIYGKHSKNSPSTSLLPLSNLVYCRCWTKTLSRNSPGRAQPFHCDSQASMGILVRENS